MFVLHRVFLLVPSAQLDLQQRWGMLVSCTLAATSLETQNWEITVFWWCKLKILLTIYSFNIADTQFLCSHSACKPFLLFFCFSSAITYVHYVLISTSGAVVGDDLPGHTVIGCNNTIGHHAVVGAKCQDMKYKVSFLEFWMTFSIFALMDWLKL